MMDSFETREKIFNGKFRKKRRHEIRDVGVKGHIGGSTKELIGEAAFCVIRW
jgi:hypothetical protein